MTGRSAVDGTVDILMITHQRPEYVELSLRRLLDTADERTRIWLWHNGDDQRTLDVVRRLGDHPRVHRLHHSEENVGLSGPTNWLWEHAEGEFLSKVDDDCLVSEGWLDTLRAAHEDFPDFGAIGSWRFLEEDFVPELAQKKLATYGTHRILRNLWVQGSGYLLRSSAVAEQGLLQPGQSFTQYCIELARRGRVNGWYFPFLLEEHMDDPRSPNTIYTTDEAFMARRPLSAVVNGVRTVADWEAQMRRSAVVAQSASLDPRDYVGFRRRRREAVKRIRKALTGTAQW